jgi:pimeloyl-ACP methyl ester carboxylesterase
MTEDYVFVFIHAAMVGAWCFERKLMPIFRKNNYRAIAFDLPGSGDDESENVNLESYVQKTLSVIHENTKEHEKVVLIAHSLGGATATLVAEQIPHKIQCVVYLAAYYLTDGQSVLDINMKVENSIGYVTDDHKYLGVKDELVKPGLYADCSDDDINFIKIKSRLQNTNPMFEKIKINGVIDTVNKYYIKTLNDKCIPPDIQESMYLGHINDVIEIDSSHSPFLSRPDELFSILIDIAKLPLQVQ